MARRKRRHRNPRRKGSPIFKLALLGGAAYFLYEYGNSALTWIQSQLGMAQQSASNEISSLENGLTNAYQDVTSDLGNI